MYLDWDITSNCNLRCSYCFNRNELGKNSISESFLEENIGCIVEKLLSLNVHTVLIGGGEPLLSGVLSKYISAFFENNIITEVTTNGTLLDEVKSRELISSGLSSLVVSLDSAYEEINDCQRGVGSFKKAVNGINLFIKETKSDLYEDIPLVSIATTITPKNIKSREDLRLLFEMASSMGVDRIRFLLVANVGAGDEYCEGISGSQQIEIADWLGELMLEYSNLTITFIAKHLILEYINSKYNPPNFDQGKYSCSGGEKFIFLNSRLELYPCYIMCDNDFQNNRIHKYFEFNSSDQYMFNISSIESNKYFNQFNLIKKGAKELLPYPCCDCKYKLECNSICSMHMVSRPLEKNEKDNLEACKYLIDVMRFPYRG